MYANFFSEMNVDWTLLDIDLVGFQGRGTQLKDIPNGKLDCCGHFSFPTFCRDCMLSLFHFICSPIFKYQRKTIIT